MQVPPSMPPPPPQAPFPLHRSKLYALILGAVALVGMILPWASANMGGLGTRSVGNGFQGWGILSLFGLIAVIVSSLIGDKLRDYDQNMRYVAIGAFSAIALGALIAFMQLNGSGQFGLTYKAGIGIWFTIIAGALGLLWVTGVIKLSSQPGRPPGHYPPPPGYPPQQHPPYYHNQYPPQYPNQYPQQPQQPPGQYPPSQQPPQQPPQHPSHPPY